MDIQEGEIPFDLLDRYNSLSDTEKSDFRILRALGANADRDDRERYGFSEWLKQELEVRKEQGREYTEKILRECPIYRLLEDKIESEPKSGETREKQHYKEELDEGLCPVRVTQHSFGSACDYFVDFEEGLKKVKYVIGDHNRVQDPDCMDQETKKAEISKWVMEDMLKTYYRLMGKYPCMLDIYEYDSLPDKRKHDLGVMPAGEEKYFELSEEKKNNLGFHEWTMDMQDGEIPPPLDWPTPEKYSELPYDEKEKYALRIIRNMGNGAYKKDIEKYGFYVWLRQELEVRKKQGREYTERILKECPFYQLLEYIIEPKQSLEESLDAGLCPFRGHPESGNAWDLEVFEKALEEVEYIIEE